MPPLQALAKSSPLSPPGTLGNSVKWYVTNTLTNSTALVVTTHIVAVDATNTRNLECFGKSNRGSIIARIRGL